jgi:toxin ParE1/3/4
VAVDLIWTTQARADLLDIYLTIGIEQPAAAERYFDEIETKVAGLVEHPRRGVRRPDIRRATRMLVESPYLVLYETVPDTDEGPVTVVEIVRVVDGRRNLSNLY